MQYQSYETHLSPKWLFKWRSYHIWMLCQMLSYWNALSFCIRFFMTKRITSVLFSFRGAIELATTVPLILSQFIENGQFLYVPYFLRSWVLLLRIKSAMKIKMNLQMTDKLVDPMKTKLIYVVSTLTVLLYNGVSAFHYTESTFGTRWYTLLESLYVVTVTLSTVGYGDITPTTTAGRSVIILFIALSLSVVPGLIADLMDTIKKKNDGGGHVQKSSVPFILIIGSFTPDQAREILDGFLNQENSEQYLSVVFLVISPLNEELKLLERNSIWGHRIRFLQATSLSNETLQRVKAQYAKAIFTMSDDSTTDPGKEDEKNTARLWALHCYTTHYNIPIYSYNLSSSTAIYQKVAQEILCVGEFKQYLLSMNCRNRGVSTLVTNLLHQRQPLNSYDEPWKAQYDDGLCNEIYIDGAAKSIIGLTFKQAAWILFRECQVILFAIKQNSNDEKKCKVLLNPCNYVVKETDHCVYIAESPKEIFDINHLSPMYIHQVLRTANNKNLYHDINLSSKTKPSLSKHKFQYAITSESSKKSMVQEYNLSRLPTHRLGLLLGSRSLVCQLGKPGLDNNNKNPASDAIYSTVSSPLSLPLTSLCYLLDEPTKINDILFDSVDHLDGHILVCIHNQVNNLFKFICNLRTHHTAHDQLQDIVLLCSTLPNEKIYQPINKFPRIFIIEGDFRQPYDLIRAGILRAKQVVIMNEREENRLNEGNSDSAAIMGSHIIDLLLGERKRENHTIINLVDKNNINYIHLLQGKDVAKDIDVIYSPVYAAGNVIADSLISNVLLSQTYYKPDIVTIIKTLMATSKPYLDDNHHYQHPYINTNKSSNMYSESIYNEQEQQPQQQDQNNEHSFVETYLTSIPLPSSFYGQTFIYLYDSFLLDYGVLCLGLLRASDIQFRNELPFVYTNPVPSLILKSTDLVYILAPDGWTL
ncbi:unnamed protein product [Cunninghamella blakesleeana]